MLVLRQHAKPGPALAGASRLTASGFAFNLKRFYGRTEPDADRDCAAIGDAKRPLAQVAGSTQTGMHVRRRLRSFFRGSSRCRETFEGPRAPCLKRRDERVEHGAVAALRPAELGNGLDCGGERLLPVRFGWRLHLPQGRCRAYEPGGVEWPRAAADGATDRASHCEEELG